MKLVSVEEMRRIEQLTDESGQSYEAMMEKAGEWVGRIAQSLRWPHVIDRALVLVGPGNNGGDGLVAAHHLREEECDVTIYIWKRDPKGDRNLSRLKRRKRGVTILWADNDPDFANLRQEVRKASVVIDALLGTGVARPLAGKLSELLGVVREEVAAINTAPSTPEPFAEGVARAPLIEALGGPPAAGGGRARLDLSSVLPGFSGGAWTGRQKAGPEDLFPPGFDDEMWDEFDDELDMFDEDELPPLSDLLPPLPVLAVDCPTGLNCDTGALDPAAVPAAVTVTFAYPKWGQVQFPGAGACGALFVVDIGVPPDLGKDLPVELVERSDVRSWLPVRPRDANKGTFGKAIIAGGSLSYTGAAALSASAAAHAGAGLVTLAVPRELHPILAGSLLEITWLPLPGSGGVHSAEGVGRLLEKLKGYDALLVGPGLTTEESAGRFLDALLGPDGLEPGAWQGRSIFDADALNLLAVQPEWYKKLPPQSILTPHPGEMSRLTGLSIAEINGSRIATARRYAAEWGHIVLLKGAYTVIAHPDGRAGVLPFADPALAKAGSGDVLAGAIVAMVAQGLDPFKAAVLGGYIHGFTGMMAGLVEGAAGVTARELLTMLPRALQEMLLRK
ncbi:MAG: NAD(P)H-hydrate dehydratase [Nitrososphaerales archaeon]